jgi:carboxyl-terminal processing protease
MIRALIILFCSLFLFSVQGQSPSRDFRKEAGLLRKILQEKHIEPRVINDQFSRDLYNTFLDALDPEHIYFTSAELSALEKYQTLLDDQLNGQGWTFLDQVLPQYTKAVDRAKLVVQKQSETAFAFNAKSQIPVGMEPWPATEPEVQKRWRTKLHRTTIDVLTETPVGNLSAQQFFQKNEATARERAKNIWLRNIERAAQKNGNLKEYLGRLYLACITALYDPHTHYDEITSVDILKYLLNSESFDFGITLQENERGKIAVASLSPGGPAWKAGIFAIGDELIELKWESQESVDVTTLPVEKVTAILDETRSSALTFSIRKPDGQTFSAALKKEKINDEENLVRSYILAGHNEKRIGYIALPDFYSSEGATEINTVRCANDVAKEIIKLKKENIEGLILDVRNNGGGSLKEAIALAGIFVDEGAIGILRHREKGTVTLKDANRGILYDGPMVLLVNGRSASASELLAAALQDYHRAVIVGSRTRGKATSQQLHIVDPNVKIDRIFIDENISVSKITMGRTYRITGKSLQGYGVIPDIALPDFREVYNFHESSRPFYLKPDSVDKKAFYRPLPPLPLQSLQEKSAARIADAVTFQTMMKKITWYQQHRIGHPQEIEWNTFSTLAKAEELIIAAHESAVNTHQNNFSVRIGIADQRRIDFDAFSKAFHESCVKALEKDIQLEEGFNIINDLININKK